MRKRTLYSYWRFSRYLLHEFRVALIVFWVLVFGGGALLWQCYHGRELGYLESAYGVFMLIFMESALEFPREWFLQPLWFVLEPGDQMLVLVPIDRIAALEKQARPAVHQESPSR